MNVLGSAISLLLSCTFFAPASEPMRMARIRVLDASLACALSRGYMRSPTLRALVERVEDSNVIVYVDRHPPAGRCDGRTQFVSAAAGYRYVRVTVKTDGVNDGLIALLGHELRHVVEVVDAPWVVDATGYAALYRRIGRPSASCRRPGWCFETQSAVDSGYRVLEELRHPPAAASITQ